MMIDRQSLTVREIIAICRHVDGDSSRAGRVSERVTASVCSAAAAADDHRVERSSPAVSGPSSEATCDIPLERGRRGFFRATLDGLAGSWLAVGFSLLAASCVAWTLGVFRFMFPNVVVAAPTRFKAGFPQELSRGQVNVRHKSQHGVWLVHDEYRGQPQIFALRAVCTHLGCIPNWLDSEQAFKCPCHGSAFDKAGINYEGPAPRPLERYAIHVAQDGQLEVDTSRTFQEELGQWSDPACFVSV